MEFRRHGMPGAGALALTALVLTFAVQSADGGQGYLTGFPSCNGQLACGCAANGEAGGAVAGTMGGPGEQFADAPFDLGEAGPAQIGSDFAAVDSAYIDDARIRSMFRLRADAAYDNPFPDRAEFFYAQCGCFGQGAPGPGVTSAATNVSYQEIWGYVETALSNNFSLFMDVPFRFVDIDVEMPANTPAAGRAQIPNSGGLSDIHFGFKYAFVACPDRYDTFQLRVYTPTGDSDRGLGTDHVSLEPSYLMYRALTERLRLNGEFRVWVPLSDSVNPLNGRDFAGTILRYGLGGAYDVHQSCDGCNRLSAVVEFVGWSVLSGQKFNPLFPNDMEAAGDTIFNVKAGGRWVFGGNQSIYAGYGRALTSEVWYTDIIRAEYTYAF
jgi:hypothetical protein